MEFNSYQAALRIRRLQQLCAQSSLDGILLVAGVDGRFSVCNQAIGYLFSGRSNRDTVDIVKLDDQLDDAVVLVTPSEVQLYVRDTELRDQLQDLLVPRVTSLRILGPTIAEAADPDLLEENKLASFVHMLRGCRRLGIPCNLAPALASPGSTTSQNTNGGGPVPSLAPKLGPEQLLALEKWPLLQAYGLEGVGRSGFFTMNFQVYDVQPYMQLLYGELDGRSLEVLVSEALPTLRQHWDEMLQALGGKPAGQRSSLNEKQVVEPLAGYFAYGMLRTAPGVEQTVTLPPRVVFGPRSSDDTARSEALPLAMCGPAPALNPTGGGGQQQEPPSHFVAEAADPRSALRVARTYFLARGSITRDVFADPDEEADQGFSFEAVTSQLATTHQKEDVVLLMRLYAALVDAARAAMSHFATVEGATALSAKTEAVGVFIRRAEQLGVAEAVGAAGSPSAAAARLRFTLVQIDHCNKVTAPAVRGSRQLKVLRLSLPDIPSRSSQGSKVLGGLVYGDTFLELPPSYISAPSGGGDVLGTGPGGGGGGWRLLVLTESVAPLVAIPAGGCEEQLAARALRSLIRVVEGGAGTAGYLRTTTLATQRDLERKAAAAAAESQALAARLRSRRSGAQNEASEDIEDLEDEVEEMAAAAAPGSVDRRPRPAEALGRLLTLGGGDEAVLLTGAAACPALYGTLYCFSAGLVFVEAVSRALWVLDFRGGSGSPGAGGLEAVMMQQLPLPHQHQQQRQTVAAASGATAVAASGAGDFSLGEAVVFRGTSPACGLAPACHLTPHTYVALPLEAMSPAARRFLIQTVLPVWNQTCREAATAATELRSETRSPVTYMKDMDAPNPFPTSLHRAHSYAIQSSSASGAVKTWPAALADDIDVQSAIKGLDSEELRAALSGLDPTVEALLLQPPTPPSAAVAAAAGGAVTLVVGLPGADQVSVAAAVATMLGEEVGPQVALLPPDAQPLHGEHFEAVLASASASRLQRQRQQHLVLATSSYTGLLEQLRMLAAAAVGGAAGRWRLAAVVVCISSDVSYEEPGRGVLAGGFLAQLLPGFLDCVVLGGNDTVKVSELAQLVTARLPDVPQVRSSRTQLLRARQELLPQPAERAARFASQRATAEREAWAPLVASAGRNALSSSSPSSSSSSSPCGGLLGPLRATRIAFEGSLDVVKLRDMLAARGIPTDPAHVPPLPLLDTDDTIPSGGDRHSTAANAPGAPGGALVCVSGCVRLSPGGRISELSGSRQSALRVKEWPLGDLPVVQGAPRLPADLQAPGGELLFVGNATAVHPAHLRALLEECGTSSTSSEGGGAVAAKLSREATSVPEAAAVSAGQPQLTSAQRAAIRTARLWDPLPEGYCFNGTQYFDAFGDASLEHPYMDRFVEEWVADQRAQKAARETMREAERRAGAVKVVHVSGPTWL